MSKLYKEEIIEYGKNPPNYGKILNPTIQEVGFNPLCGDRITIYLTIENDIIKEATFEADACLIAKAAVARLTERLQGVSQKTALSWDKNTVLSDFDNNLSPARIKCALLGLETLKTALKK